MNKKNHGSDRLQLVFAQIEAALPSSAPLYLKPDPIVSERLQRKARARAMANGLLRLLLQQNGLSPEFADQIERTPSGRPFIRALPQLDFNISHSGDYVAVVFRLGMPQQNAVGLDIEQPQKARNFQKLLAYYANEEEIADFSTNPSACRFYLSWCLREAVLKAQGVGLVKLSSVRFLPTSGQIFCPFCPRGELYFMRDLPFYLALFKQTQNENMLSFAPRLQEWRDGALHTVSARCDVYSVNQ